MAALESVVEVVLPPFAGAFIDNHSMLRICLLFLLLVGLGSLFLRLSYTVKKIEKKFNIFSETELNIFSSGVDLTNIFRNFFYLKVSFTCQKIK